MKAGGSSRGVENVQVSMIKVQSNDIFLNYKNAGTVLGFGSLNID